MKPSENIQSIPPELIGEKFRAVGKLLDSVHLTVETIFERLNKLEELLKDVNYTDVVKDMAHGVISYDGKLEEHSCEIYFTVDERIVKSIAVPARVKIEGWCFLNLNQGCCAFILGPLSEIGSVAKAFEDEKYNQCELSGRVGKEQAENPGLTEN